MTNNEEARRLIDDASNELRDKVFYGLDVLKLMACGVQHWPFAEPEVERSIWFVVEAMGGGYHDAHEKLARALDIMRPPDPIPGEAGNDDDGGAA